MGRQKGSKCTAEQKANMRRGQLRRWRLKEKREREHQEFLGSISPDTLAAPAAAPDTKRPARSTLLARLRSLEGQLTTRIESDIAIRRQIIQLRQEVEA